MKNMGSVFKGKNKIATSAKVVNSFVENSIICENVEIYNSVIKDSVIKHSAVVGPFAHIRDCALIGEEVRLGNFVEVKNSKIGKNTKVAHMSYIGDAEIGESCNIGAGVIFCNYDGFAKQKIRIGDWVFIGSNSNLIAPLEIKDRAFISAGTTVTKSVKEETNIIGRVRQEEFSFKNPYLKNIRKPQWFGTDGIRGVWGEDLNKTLVKEVAKSLRLCDAKTVVLGRDTRPSGKKILQIFKNVLSQSGLKFVDLGIVSTPCVAFATRLTKADFGVMITASHNPSKFNGIKLFNKDGEKISQQKEVEIEKYFFKNSFVKKIKNNKNKLKNKYFLIKQYKNYIKNYFSNNLNKLKIIIDCANGSANFFAKELFESLGAQVYAINTKGEINKNCGALFPQKLQNLVQKEKADLGFAFDGDADRVIAVNCNGDVLDGDDILFVLAKYFEAYKKLSPPIVVGTIITNLGLEQKLLESKIQLLKVQVGDKWVAEKLKKHNLFLGAEQAGHIVFNNDFCLGDGLLVARVLAEVYQKMPDLFKECLLGKTCQFHKSLSLENLVIDEVCTKEIVDNLNSSFLPSARVVVRKSGTENKLRLLAESKDALQAENLLNLLEEKIKVALNEKN